MQVKITGVTGPGAGQSACIGAGDVIEVGRSSRCGFVVQDMRMSGLHFSLEFDGTDCLVRDLRSRNGVLVNGERVAEATVFPGDQISAGKSTFGISMVEPSDRPAESALPTNHSVEVAPSVTEPVPAGARFQRTKCLSGLNCFTGIEPPVVPARSLAFALAKLRPLYLVATPGRLGIPLREGIADGYLFDWLEPEVARGVSPIAFPAEQSPFQDADTGMIIDGGWGKDALICLFSKSPWESVLQHLRLLMKGKELPDVEPLPGQASGICWPRVASQLLSLRPPEVAKFTMSGIDAVLMEGLKPNSWQVFSGSGFGKALEELGINEYMMAKQESE